MKTPDEIKKGLRLAASEADDMLGSCDVSDILDSLEVSRNFMFEAADVIEELEKRLAQAERERDAAVRDVETLCLTEDFNGDYCEYCKHQEPDGGCHHECMPYHECGWQWRGVVEGNSK